MRLSRVAPVLLLAGVALAAVHPRGVPAEPQSTIDKKINDQQSELDRIKKQIDKHRRESRQLKKEEEAEVGKLSRLEREIDLTETLIRELQRQETLFEQQIDSLATAIVDQGGRLEEQRDALAGRLRQMYKRDPDHRWEIVVGSQSLQEAVIRYKFMKIIAEQDAMMVTRFRDGKSRLETENAVMTEALSEVALVRQSRQNESQQLLLAKNERKRIIGRIRSEKSKHAGAIKQLEKAQEEVTDLLGQLEKKRLEEGVADAGDFPKLKGKLAWPVEGKVLRGYGKIKHPKYGTVTFNNGIDIQAPAGTPILAVATGVVEFVDWIDAYGKCVIVNHGGGYYTLYAHVGSTFINQGQSVSYGDVIAEVGDSGTLEGYSCHFEIRHSKKALNPTEWLIPRKRSS